MTLRLIVTDTSPLITLAISDELDLLLRPALALSIPDAVYVEATRIRGAPGASAIVDWLNARRNAAAIVPTEVGIDQLRRLEEGRSIRGLGEAAAVETLDRLLSGEDAAGLEAVLLFEDSDVIRRRALIDDRVTVISTGDYLRQLEAAGLIQSSDHVLDKAAAAGRNIEHQRRPASDASAVRRFGDSLKTTKRS